MSTFRPHWTTLLIGLLLAVVAAAMLTGCGDERVVDLCPNTPCSQPGKAIDLFPGCAVCERGVWVQHFSGDRGCASMGFPATCAAGLPSKVVPSPCTYESVNCR